MRKVVFILSLIVILFFVVFLSLWFSRNSVGNTLSPPMSGFTKTITESKEKGVFKYEIVPDKSLYLLESGLSFQIDSSWVENGWSKQHYMFAFGMSPYKKHDWSQLIINLHVVKKSIQKNEPFRYFIGFKRLDSFVCYHSIVIDSINIKVPIYRDTVAHPRSKKGRIAFDTIRFVKRINPAN